MSKITPGEMLLAINDMHNLALGSRIVGEYGGVMQQIEQIAESVLERACNDGAEDTSFVVADVGFV